MDDNSQHADLSLEPLHRLMAHLRDPEQGCPWVVAQTSASIAPYVIEEAYEVDTAIRQQDSLGLCDELGDLLLQVVFHAQMAQEVGHFTLKDVVAAIETKLIRRHPHVFSQPDGRSAEQQKGAWEVLKAAERGADSGALAGVAHALPALIRAEKLQKRAAQQGFDWPSCAPVFEKISEELEETRMALDSGDRTAVREEIGDLLFAVVNLARHVQVDAETALREANHKFERRFAAMESLAQQDAGPPFPARSLDEQEQLWLQVKRSLATKSLF